jgi:hypothetical protein
MEEKKQRQTEKKNASFRNGYRQLRVCDLEAFKETLKAKLGYSDQTFRLRLRGKIEPKMSEIEVIEQTFAEFGVTRNIWGE